ncbi:unnamed protein product [Miscanthus lutarioriparius]|uniref:Transposase Tnp1/En/Spm-like domain-containing protein n=1 Tax=Miscanthus lutarioriparius TaxID=422564 RepID=A0A811MHL6_9POAL|nr:unnamed protein product [Miscanthus lutarioriparius]
MRRCGEPAMQAQARETRMQQQFLRPGRSRCGGGVPPIPRRQQSTSSRCSKPSLDASSSYGRNCARSDHNNSQNQAVLSKRKGHHGGPGETTTIAHQEVAHDKVTCNKRQAPKQLPVMKVGSMVLLMTSKYPNKANVAYVTFLSTALEAIVGGVKTGSQFYKVRIDHAIAKDEPLVRHRPGCNNIGDAQAK